MEKQTGRLEALSDGVFGVAITLLALEIGIKEYEGATNASLWHDILERWPEYFTYFNSFAVVLLIWMGHHALLKAVRVASTGAMLLNGLILLLVALFPFPTRTVGRFLGTGAQSTAVTFYAAYTGLISLSMLLLMLYLRGRPRLLADGSRSVTAVDTLLKGAIGGVTAYALLAAAALARPRLALAGTFLMWVFWAAVTARSAPEDGVG
jgi:uncharacterized membrane protein